MAEKIEEFQSALGWLVLRGMFIGLAWYLGYQGITPIDLFELTLGAL